MKYTNIKRGVSPSSSIRPPSPSIRTNQHHIPVRSNAKTNIASSNNVNNDIDRELLSQSADFDGPDIEIQSILSSAAQSSIHDLVLAQKQDRYLSSVLPISNTNDADVEDEENIENDVEVAITDAESDKTDLTSFASYMQTTIIDNKNLSSDSRNQEINEMLSHMPSQTLAYFMESIMKEVEKRKDTANAIQNGVTIAGRAGLEDTINPNVSTSIRRPSFEKVERKASPSLNKNNKNPNLKITKFDGNKGSVSAMKKSNNAIILSRPTVQRIPNKSNKINPWTSYKGKKNNTPFKGTSNKDAHEETRECDFDEELREINVSPTLRSSFDGLTLIDKNKIQQRVNNRHGAAHPHEKMFKTGPRYNPSPPTTTTQKARDTIPSVISEAMKLFSFKKPKSSKEKQSQEDDLIVVEAIKVKNLRCANIDLLSDDESSNGQSSFSISASTAFDDRSAGSSSRCVSIK